MEVESDQGESGSVSRRPDSPPGDEIIVRADEVDVEGVDISEISSTNDQELGARVEARRQQDAQNPGGPRALANNATGTLKSPSRPILRREVSAPPPPPRQPPPPAPPTQQDEIPPPADSLSLGQLKSLVANFPKLEPTAYAYIYEDTRTFPEELEEWFQYTEEDRGFLARAKEAFDEVYGDIRAKELREGSTSCSWLTLSIGERKKFVGRVLKELEDFQDSTLPYLEALSYIAMGVWSESTSKEELPLPEEEHEYEPPNDKYRRTVAQLRWIQESAELLCQLGAPQLLFRSLATIWELDRTTTDPDQVADKETVYRGQQVNSILTTLYFIVESGRQKIHTGRGDSIRLSFAALEPNFLQYLSHTIAKLRWDDESSIPFTRIMLLLWKSTLLVFGGCKELNQCKSVLSEEPEVPDKENREPPLIASPLDYHVFRQEITSKYPAYNPPAPLVPLEPNNNSMLPPLSRLSCHPSRSASQDSLQSLGGPNGYNKSIFNQPVHIATPAPSPPPSPAGPGGKGGKKQNYQTNQNFPFLYPPLDSTSNEIGGKGQAGQQGKLVGKRWEGSDVPASILEAGELFASRMRMSRPLQQLWEIREEFVKFERGWKEDIETESKVQGLGERLERMNLEEGSEDSKEGKQHQKSKLEKQENEKETDDEEVQSRLDAVETYFKGSFPHLQSIIIVLLKILLSNVTVLGALNSVPNSAAAPTDIEDIKPMEEEMPPNNINLCRQLSGITGNQRPEDAESADKSLEELNAIRTREITSKAISAFLLILLKWFRISHVLKFEYATQLLLDSNYLPLALKYFALQDIDRAVDLKHDREDLNFFRFCRLSAGHPSTPSSPISLKHPASPSSSEEDDAAPPPILRRRPTSPTKSPPSSPGSQPSPPRRPEVDELGYPTTTLPQSPLTTYAPRFFHTHITTLRLLQKLTKNHAHRALLLVQYKSSTILRKALKLPQPQVRLYSLKLFKTQVPFCGRKWRQANMRVITAIYVFCRMGLRDEWISGAGAVEEAVDGAVGTESAWRGLVGWWLGRRYRDAVVGQGLGEEEVEEDFFSRELEKMGFCQGGPVAEDDDGQWDGCDGQGQLHLEGWA